jgi:hypothetical protein
VIWEDKEQTQVSHHHAASDLYSFYLMLPFSQLSFVIKYQPPPYLAMFYEGLIDYGIFSAHNLEKCASKEVEIGHWRQ